MPNPTSPAVRAPAYRPLVGAGLAVGAGLCFSTGGIFVRSVSVDAWEIIFFRCWFAALAILIFLLARERRNSWAVLRGVRWPSFAAAICTAGAMIAYVIAMQYTLVANVISIMTTSTVMVALMARPLLGEVVPLRTWLAVLGSLAGVAVMFSAATGAGGLIGNLVALGVALGIAGQTLIVRKYRQIQIEPVVLIATCLAGLVALPLALPIDSSVRELGVLAAFGITQLSIALTLYFYAARYVPASTLIFVVLIDAVLAPIWVWLGFDEVPGSRVLAGSGVILASITVNALLGLRQAAQQNGAAGARSRPLS